MKSRGLEYGVINALREAVRVTLWVLLPAGGHEPPSASSTGRCECYELQVADQQGSRCRAMPSDAEGSVSDAAHAVLLLTASRSSRLACCNYIRCPSRASSSRALSEQMKSALACNVPVKARK